MKHPGQVSTGKSKPTFLAAVAIFLFTFLCFFPNPAVPLGTSSGLQAGQIVALLALPVALILGLSKRLMLVLLLLVLPVLLSTFITMTFGRSVFDEVAWKTLINMLLVFVVLIPAGTIMGKVNIQERYAAPLLLGVAWAVLFNVLVGVYQVYWFTWDKMPLAELYQNPAFAGPTFGDLDNWARWVKRPFGLFPEPSAMAASIGPWLILIVGLLLYHPKLSYGITRKATALLVLAGIGGVSLIILSASGYTFWLVACLLLVVLPAVKNQFLRLHHPRSMLYLLAIFLVGTAVVALSVIYLQTRVEGYENASWSSRGGSLVWGLSFLGTSWGNMFFGTGPGQSFLILNYSNLRGSLPSGNEGLAADAVWSVIVTYIQEQGLLGATALALILIVVLRAIASSSARLVGMSCLVAWLAGVILTTSYFVMLPVWLFLALLVGWDWIFKVRPNSSSFEPKLGVLKPGAPSVQRRTKTWS